MACKKRKSILGERRNAFLIKFPSTTEILKELILDKRRAK